LPTFSPNHQASHNKRASGSLLSSTQSRSLYALLLILRTSSLEQMVFYRQFQNACRKNKMQPILVSFYFVVILLSPETHEGHQSFSVQSLLNSNSDQHPYYYRCTMTIVKKCDDTNEDVQEINA